MTPKEKIEELKQKFQESYNQGKLHEQCISLVVEECIRVSEALSDDWICNSREYTIHRGGMRNFWKQAKEELNLEQDKA